MILLREKITRLGEIFNRRHNVILHRVARTINASRRVLKKDDFYNRNPRFKHGQKGRVLALLLVTGESGDISRRPICRSGTLSNFCRYNTAKFYVAAPLKTKRGSPQKALLYYNDAAADWRFGFWSGRFGGAAERHLGYQFPSHGEAVFFAHCFVDCGVVVLQIGAKPRGSQRAPHGELYHRV